MNLVLVESSQRACQPSGMDVARPAMGDDTYIPIHIHENDVYEGASKIIKVLRPNWKLENVIYKVRFIFNEQLFYPYTNNIKSSKNLCMACVNIFRKRQKIICPFYCRLLLMG